MAMKKKRKLKKASAPVSSEDNQMKPVDRLVDNLLDDLNSDKGSAPAQLLGSDGKALKIRGVISTQCVTIDRAIGRGGIPLSRVTIIHGKEGCGKTTLALHLVAEIQRINGLAIYIDSEHKLDPDYAKKIGIETDKLLVIQPDYLEKTFEYIERIIKVTSDQRKKGETVPILVILDSMNATISKAVFDGTWEDQHYAPEASVWSRSLPKLVPMLDKEDVALVLISQVREKIGVVYGKKEKTFGGLSPGFYASLLLEVKRKGTIGDKGKIIIGNESEVFVGKNQIAPPYKTAKFRILYNVGIDYEHSLFKAALDEGLIKQSGSWFSYKGEKLGQGEETSIKNIRKNKELKKELLEELDKD